MFAVHLENEGKEDEVGHLKFPSQTLPLAFVSAI